MKSAGFEELLKGKKLYLVALTIIALMILNYYLIFLADTVVTHDMIYYEIGIVEKNKLIPTNIPGTTLFRAGEAGSYIILEISGVNGSCLLRGIKSNHTYLFTLNHTNNSVLLRIDRGELFIVKEVSGNLTYSYGVYVENKPYKYLALVAFIISLVGFTISFYILFTLMSSKMLRKSRRKTIFATS